MMVIIISQQHEHDGEVQVQGDHHDRRPAWALTGNELYSSPKEVEHMCDRSAYYQNSLNSLKK